MRFGIREIVFLVVLLAVPAASFFYVFQPRNSDIAAAEAELEHKRERLDQLERMQQKIEDIGLAIERGRDSIDAIERKLPNEEEVDDILEQVWQLAKRNQLVVKSVNTDKAVPAAMYLELPLKVVMEGQFTGYYQFLLDLEGIDRITRIQAMDLARIDQLDKPGSSDEVQPGAMRAEFTLSIYFETRSARADAS